jgi:hypothetical protein
MTGRRAAVAFGAAILVGVAGLFFLRSREASQAGAPARVTNVPVATPTKPQPAPLPPPAVAPPVGGEVSHLADQLNAPEGTIRHDLEILNEVFTAWQTNFPHDGNPVGENAEITAALTGDNRFHFAFIPRNHPAINAAGELCDRWGTPFRFHQVSGTQMEIRSAGPDRKFATADDVTLP